MPQKQVLPRREREKLRQRQEMLAAALTLFSQKGYHNVSMNEIAEKSEFAMGTLYKFFPSKEELYKSLLTEMTSAFHAATMRAFAEGVDEIDKLRRYVAAKGAVFKEHLPMVRLFVAETPAACFSVKEGFDADFRKKYEDVQQAMTAVFARGIKRKVFRAIATPDQLALALDSICRAFLLRWLEEPEEHPFPEDPDVILDILFLGLLVQ